MWRKPGPRLMLVRLNLSQGSTEVATCFPSIPSKISANGIRFYLYCIWSLATAINGRLNMDSSNGHEVIIVYFECLQNIFHLAKSRISLVLVSVKVFLSAMTIVAFIMWDIAINGRIWICLNICMVLHCLSNYGIRQNPRCMLDQSRGILCLPYLSKNRLLSNSWYDSSFGSIGIFDVFLASRIITKEPGNFLSATFHKSHPVMFAALCNVGRAWQLW